MLMKRKKESSQRKTPVPPRGVFSLEGVVAVEEEEIEGVAVEEEEIEGVAVEGEGVAVEGEGVACAPCLASCCSQVSGWVEDAASGGAGLLALILVVRLT